MFSKLLLPLLILSLTACSLRLNETVQPTTVEVNPVQSGCLAGAGDVMNRFFTGQIAENELDAFWACTEKALTSFQENTRGREQDSFTGPELAAFLSRFFLGRPVPPALVREVVALKKGMIGGGDEITRAELQKILTFMRAKRALSLRLRPYMPFTAAGFLARNTSAEEFENALAIFREGVKEIGQSLAGGQGSYRFDQLTALHRELRAFLYPGAEGQNLWIDTVIQWSQALGPAKQIFISPPAEQIAGADWAKIFDFGPRYFSLALRANFYFHSNRNAYTFGPGLRNLEELFDDTLDLFRDVLDNHPGGAVPIAEVEQLHRALSEHGLLTVHPDTLNKFAHAFFGRLLAARPGDGDVRFNRASLDQLSQTFRFTTEGFRALEALYRGKLGDNFRAGTLDPATIAFTSPDSLLPATALRNDLSRLAVQDLLRTPLEVKTIFPAGSFVVALPKAGVENRLSHWHMSLVHILRSVNLLLLRGYGSRTDSMSAEEIGHLADDVFPLLEELKIVSTETRATVPKRLLEASMFLYTSDGFDSLTMPEALEFETLLLSTLIKANQVHKELAGICGSTPGERGEALVPVPCFENSFLRNRRFYWDQIPGFVQFAVGQQKAEDMYARMRSFLRKGREQNPYPPGDTQSFILLPYYVELLFSRFDRDQDGLFTKQEAEVAYPVFRTFLAKKAREQGLSSEEDFHTLYLYLLANQELPSTVDWVWRRYLVGSSDFAIDRAQVIAIFQLLLSR